ncbi:MAG: glycosyltransferase family 4 protein [Porphyrobacter sp.]|nr:glycosyltransferase family 4 protein [Porphyrobacter sp.]
MRVVLINRFFHPDESATALMLTDLVTGLANPGLDLHVITAAAAYTPSGEHARDTLGVDRLSVTRLPNLPLSHHSLAARALNFLAFYCGLLVAGLFRVRRGDIVICLTDPPLVGIVAALLTRLKGATLIHWVQDIYPETATRLGFGTSTNPAVRLAIRLRDWAWGTAHTNVVIGERMHAMLVSRGVVPARLHIIQNWAEEEALTPLAAEHNPLRAQWGFGKDVTVVGYSGNLGRAHDAATMLDAAALLGARQDAPIRLLFIGGGAKHALLETAADDPRLSNIVARRPYRPRAELQQSLSVPDIHWLSLEPELEGLIVPSKFYGAAAVGRPIIFIGDTDGEVARLIAKAQCGASFAKGDAEGVANYLAVLAKDRALQAQLGENARHYCTAHLSKEQRMDEWRSLVASV